MNNRRNPKSKFKKKEPKEFAEEVIQIDRVTRVVKGGRKLRFRATVAIGDKKGKVGIGVGKSKEVTGAISKAISKAKKSLITVPIDGATIPHNIKIKYKSSRIVFMPAGPGTGIIAGGPIRKVLDLAGIKDILSKSFGTTNKVNNTKATYEALGMLQETPAMARRMKASREADEKNAKAKKVAPSKTEEKVEKKEEAPKVKKTTAKKEEKPEENKK